MRFLSTLAASVLGTLIALGVVILFLFFFFFAIALSTDTQPSVTSGSALVVTLDGTVPETVADDPFARAFGDAPEYDLRDLQSALTKAASDARIEAVRLDIKSAPTEWARLEEIRSALVAFKESGKPIIAYGGEFRMSEGEYFLATAADSIFAAPLAPFTLNGFSITQPFYRQTMEKLDIEPKIVRAGRFKSAVEPFLRDDLSDDNRMQLTALLEAFNDTFKEAVASARGMTPDAIEQMADEDAVLDSDVALRRGLLDGLKYANEVDDVMRDVLGVGADATIPTIDVRNYARIPASDAGLTTTGDGTVAIVYAEGAIVPGEPEEQPFGPQGSFIGSKTFNDAMREARESSTAKAVVLRINSPGGAANAAESMWNEVRRTADVKPVIVSMGDVAASGGYYIAAPADTIVADPTTITGSIGVFGQFFNTRGFFENKLGVTFDGVSTSPYADIYSLVQPFDEGERRLLERSVDRTYDVFLDRVEMGRGMDSTAVHAVAQGRVWSGRDAVDAGLVDVLGGLEDAVALAGQKGGLGDGPYRTQILPRPKTFLERFNESFSNQARNAWLRLTTSRLERDLMQQMRILEQVYGQQGSIQARLPVDFRIE